MGKWQPSDDYLLIQSILQLSCLKAVHQCTKFSAKFTIKELQERWYAILYDPSISKYLIPDLFFSSSPKYLQKLDSFIKSYKHLIIVK
jgi:hypothetical protein